MRAQVGPEPITFRDTSWLALLAFSLDEIPLRKVGLDPSSTVAPTSKLPSPTSRPFLWSLISIRLT